MVGDVDETARRPLTLRAVRWSMRIAQRDFNDNVAGRRPMEVSQAVSTASGLFSSA